MDSPKKLISRNLPETFEFGPFRTAFKTRKVFGVEQYCCSVTAKDLGYDAFEEDIKKEGVK